MKLPPPSVSLRDELHRMQLVEWCVYQIASAPLPDASTVEERRRWARDVFDSLEKGCAIGHPEDSHPDPGAQYSAWSALHGDAIPF